MFEVRSSAYISKQSVNNSLGEMQSSDNVHFSESVWCSLTLVGSSAPPSCLLSLPS